MAEKQFNPYGQHYRSTARLFRNSTINDIYTFLLDEYMVRLRNNIPSPSLHFHLSHIAEGAGVYRGCVKNNLDKLSQLQVIFSPDEDYDTIYMRTNYFESVVSLFNSKSTLKEKHEVEKAFRNADMVALNKLGYEECEDGDTQLLLLEGSMNVGEAANMSLKQQTCRSTDTIVGTPTIMSVEQQTCRFSSKHVGRATYLSVLHHSLEAIFDEFPQKSDFIRYISGLKCEIEAENTAFELADLLYSEEIAEDSPILSEIGVLLAIFALKSGMSLNQQSCRLSDIGMSVERHEIEKTCRFSNNRNKYINKKETKTEIDEENEDEQDENSQEEELLNLDENVEVVEREIVRKPKNIYPFFKNDEVDAIVNDINVASSSPLKLFLYNLWGYVSDMTNPDDGRVTDEDGNDNLSEEDFFNPDGATINKQDFFRCLNDAYEDTADDIRLGSPADDETIQLQLKEMFDKKLLYRIVEWKTVVFNRNDVSVVISKDGIRNIEAEEIKPSVKKPEGRDEKREAAKECKKLMKRIWIAGNDTTLNSQLTSIERIIFLMMQEYYQPNKADDPDQPFTLSQGSTLTRDQWRALSLQIEKNGLSADDFFKCITNIDTIGAGEQLPLNNAPFFAEGVRYVNDIKQEQSVLDEIEV